MFMIIYFKMKKNEWKVKAELYKLASDFIDNKKEILEIIKNLYNSLKDVPLEELRNEFIQHLAKIIHEEVHKGDE